MTRTLVYITIWSPCNPAWPSYLISPFMYRTFLSASWGTVQIPIDSFREEIRKFLMDYGITNQRDYLLFYDKQGRSFKLEIEMIVRRDDCLDITEEHLTECAVDHYTQLILTWHQEEQKFMFVKEEPLFE